MSVESVMPPTTSCSATPFFFLLQSSSGSFPTSRLFASGGQRIGASASVLPMNIQGWFPLGLTGLISLQPKRPLRVFSSTTIQNHQLFGAQSSLWSSSHIRIWLLKKIVALTIGNFVSKVMTLFFNALSGFVIAFLSRSKQELIYLYVQWKP